jgi:pteridine reductase
MNEHQKGVQASNSRFCKDTSIYVLERRPQIMSAKVCLVTGSGRRIGASIIRKFASEGYAVLIHVSTSVEAGESLKSELIEQGHQADLLRADLSSEDETNELIERVVNHPFVIQRDGLDVLVHNASVYSQTPIDDLSLETMRFLNRLHVEAPLQISQGLVQSLASVNGSIVGMTDTSAGKAWKQLSHYTSSKAGLRQLMFNLAGEYAPRVRVNCVAPGAILSADWEHEHFSKIVQTIPLKRSGDPGDVAGAVYFFATSPYLTGQELFVDGGWALNSS